MSATLAAVFIAMVIAPWSLPRWGRAGLGGLCIAKAQSLVGPGAMAPYSRGGGGRGRRHGGYVRVRDPAFGFFVAGSTIKGLNGLYGRVESIPRALSHDVQLAYMHDQTKWHMVLTRENEGTPSEWLFVDPHDYRDRFRHAGNTIIPGAGRKWRHVHRPAPNTEVRGPDSQVSERHEDDVGELPWQVIAILGKEMLEKLRRRKSYYDHNIRRALGANSLPPVVGPANENSPPEFYAAPERAQIACEDGEVDKALEIFNHEISRSSVADPWRHAVMLLHASRCARRNILHRKLDVAIAYLESALKIFPRFTQAIFEQATALIETGQAKLSIRKLQHILRIDRHWPNLLDWLVRAHSMEKRVSREVKHRSVTQKLEKGATTHCVAWRQTKGCNSDGVWEPESDRACHESSVHTGISGFCECREPVISLDVSSEAHKNLEKDLVSQLSKAGAANCDRVFASCEQECAIAYSDAIKKVSESVERAANNERSAAWNAVRSAVHQWEVQTGKLLSEKRAAQSSEETSDEVSYDKVFLEIDHYGRLGLSMDFTSSELRKAYRRQSLANHPDKTGGSEDAFQRVALAFETLSNEEKRKAYDRGTDLDDEDSDETFYQTIHRHYFPDAFGFHPFGDPLESHREEKSRRQQFHETKGRFLGEL